MYLFECQNAAMPCPLEFQNRILLLTTENLQALGITAESISKSVALGFAIVMSLGLSGYAVGIAKIIISQL
ncbi:MAG: hypothetical protein Q4A28_05075 [Brachymonas sp.]|nr:hypothetical protein [Brachymonas sp.]